MNEFSNKQAAHPCGFQSPHALAECDPKASVLVALSGGPDSRTLLHLLASDAAQKGYLLYAAHVNHGIRGEEADRDETFCKQVAASYGIPLFVLRANVPAMAKQSGQSVETTARNVRYEYFSRMMREHAIPLLATAHNADDNLETVLFNLMRGCGLDGLCGIPPVRSTDGGTLVRPLLTVTRQDILDYCQAHALSFVTDSTNTDTQYTRNRIRAELLPALRAMEPAIAERMTRTCTSLRADAAYLRTEAEALLAQHRQGFSLPISVLNRTPLPVAARALMLLFRERTGGVALEQCHVRALLALCEQATPHARIDLPCGYMACIADGMLGLETPPLSSPAPDAYSLPLCEGCNRISQTNCEIVIGNSQNPKNVYKKAIRMYFASDKIVGTIVARNRRPGDRIWSLGVHKDVRKLMSEKKLPPSLRERIPVLCDDHGIFAVPFVAIRDDVYVAPEHGDPAQHLIIDCFLCE